MFIKATGNPMNYGYYQDPNLTELKCNKCNKKNIILKSLLLFNFGFIIGCCATKITFSSCSFI